MLPTLIRWEIRSLLRDPAAWAALVLALGAVGFALANGLRWQRHLDGLGRSVAQVETETRTHARTLAARLDVAPDPLVAPLYDPRNAYGYAYFQMQHAIALPPAPLAALGVGQSDVLANVLPLTPGPAPALLGTAEPDNPHRQLSGRFDAAFVVVFLLPLLVIGLTHGLISGERERGTLPLLLSQPLSVGRLMLGRLAPRLFLVAALVGTLALGVVMFAPPIDGNAAGRLALWCIVALAYAAFWFAVTLRVIARPGGSAHHALVLAVWWLALVVVAPAAINLAVKSLAPVPSRLELILALRAAGDEALAERSRLLAAYYEDHPEFAPAGTAVEFAHVRIVTYRKLERDLAPVLARFEERLAAQQALVEKLAFLSPALLAHHALAEAAGTGLERHRAFMRQAAAHHATLRDFLNPHILAKQKFTAWDELPAFRFTEEPAARSAARTVPTLTFLLLAATALALWAAHALRRVTA